VKKNWNHPSRVTLHGGFECELTCEQTNLWSEFVENTPEFERVKKNSAAKWAAENSRECDTQKLIDLFIESQAARVAMYHVAKKWYAALEAAEDEKLKQEASRRANET